jgi:hypothetical protein
VTRRPIPEVAYVLAGQAEADRLRSHGIELDGVLLSELGRAVLDHQQPADASDPHLSPLLARVHDRNRVERQELERSPEESVRTAPDDFQNERQPGLGDGQGHAQRGEVERPPVRKMMIEDFLRESHDEHEEWT